jgi:hypothetical protein
MINPQAITSIDLGLWTTWGTGTQVEADGTLQQTATGVSGQYVGIYSNGTFDFTNKTAIIQFAQLPSATTGNQAVLRCEIDANNAVIIGYSDGGLLCQHQITGTITNVYYGAWPANTIGMKIVFDNANNLVWWATTVDGITWTSVFSEAIPIATTALRVSIATGCYQATAVTGTTKWESTGLPVVRYGNLTGTATGSSTSSGTASFIRYKNITPSTTYPCTGAGITVGLITSSALRATPMLIRQIVTAQAYDVSEFYVQLQPTAPNSVIIAIVEGGTVPGHANVGTITWQTPAIHKFGVAQSSLNFRQSSSAANSRQIRSADNLTVAGSTTLWGVGISVRCFITAGSTLGELRATVLEVAGARLTPSNSYIGNTANASGTSNPALLPSIVNTVMGVGDTGFLIGAIAAGQTVDGTTFTQTGMPGKTWRRVDEENSGTIHIPLAVDTMIGHNQVGDTIPLNSSWTLATTGVQYAMVLLSYRGPTPSLVGTATCSSYTPRLTYTGSPLSFRSNLLFGQVAGQATCVGLLTSRRGYTDLPVGAPTATFTTDGTLDTGWTYGGTLPGVQSVAGGILSLGTTGGQISDSRITSNSTVNILNKSVVAEIVTLPTAASFIYAMLRLETDAGHWWQFGYTNGNMAVHYATSGIANTLMSAPWPAGTRGLRIRVEGPLPITGLDYRLYFEYTIDGAHWLSFSLGYYDTYSSIRSAINPAAVKVVLICYTTSGTSATTAQWDNVNIIPFPWVPYKSLIGFSIGQSLGGNYYKSVLGDNPIGYWRLGETAGTTAADSSGRTHTGTYAGTGVTLNQPSSLAGDPDPSVLLAGTSGASGSVSIPAHTDWRPVGGGWSMEAWIRSNPNTGTQEIIRLGGGDGWFLRNGGGFLGTLWGMQGGVFPTPTGGVIPGPNIWSHVVGTYDGQFIRHYVNGIVVYSVAETRIFGPTSTNAVAIGSQDPSSGGEFFTGNIDEVAVYNYALSPGQVYGHYIAGLNTPSSLTKGAAKVDIVGLAAGAATENGQINVRRLLGIVSSAGAATEVGQPTRKRAIVVTSAGVATVSVTIAKRPSLFGTSAGTATEVGQPSRKRALVAASSGQTTVTVTISKTLPSINAPGSNGIATVSVQLTRRRALIGVSAGAATEVGQPSGKRSMVVASAGAAADSGQPARRRAMIVASVGQAVSSGSILRKVAIVARADGTTTVFSFLQIRSSTIPPVISAGVATASGLIGRKRQIAGASAGKTTVTAVILCKRAIVALSVGVAVAGATIQRERQLSASAMGVAIANASVQRKRAIVARADGTASVAIPLLLRKVSVVGTTHGLSATVGNLRAKKIIVGTSNGRATGSGRAINFALTLWNGSTFVLQGSYPVVLWDQAEFELAVEEGEQNVDYVAYTGSIDQFHPVEP